MSYINLTRTDVIGIVDENGKLVVEYEYDAWGAPLGVTGELAGTLGADNPFRYRGYYYDSCSGLYYLQSRYYDPQVGRWLNTDVLMGVNNDMATYNLYTYCGNNPINRYDNNGMFWKEIFRGVVRTVINAIPVEIGAFFLMMEKDGDGNYHAKQNCWQQFVGYNDLYDGVFGLVTSMAREKFPFSCNGNNYMLWAWKGDYINLGAGAEMGIYVGNGPHYFVDKSQAMTMMLGIVYNGENILWYAPDEKQWWITGFNPNYKNKNASDLTAVFGIIFNNNSMYNAFYGRYSSDPRWTFIPWERGAVFVF